MRTHIHTSTPTAKPTLSTLATPPPNHAVRRLPEVFPLLQEQELDSTKQCNYPRRAIGPPGKSSETTMTWVLERDDSVMLARSAAARDDGSLN